MNGLILEGTAEQAIIDILLENKRLIFNEDELIHSSKNDYYQVGLSAKNYQGNFLRYEFDDEITIHVILDDPKRVLKLYNVDNLIYYVTREEIEAIQLYANPEWQRQYSKYVKRNSSGKLCKPSAFFKNSNEGLGIKDIKSYDFVYDLWSNNVNGLINAMKHVKQSMEKKRSIQKCLHNKKGKDIVDIEYKYLADLLK